MTDSGSYLRLGEQFLGTAKSVLTEMIRHENRWVVVSDRDISEADCDEATRWSDFGTMVPTLFLFYHGSELLVKGVLRMRGVHFESEHDLSKLLRLIPGNDPCQSIVPVIEKYISAGTGTPRFLLHYLLNNKVLGSPKVLYESLRYPESVSGLSFDHSFLRYNSKSVLTDVQELAGDITRIVGDVVKVLRALQGTRP